MADHPTRVGINGFGRIGRVLARIIAARSDLVLAAVNDLTEDRDNLAYLYNFDSTYGRAVHPAVAPAGGGMEIAGRLVAVHCERDPREVPWDKAGVEILIDATGVKGNMALERQLLERGTVRKVIITNAPGSEVDLHVIMGVNHERYDPAAHHMVASSICDANAIAHPLDHLERTVGIAHGMVTTLHPWLSYQNLLDGPVASVANPGHVWKDYSLGRSSTDTLIPKDTTAVAALKPVLPDLVERLRGFSYRTPTAIVTSADLTLELRDSLSEAALRESLETMCRQNPFIEGNRESLVGRDYTAVSHSAVVDLQWSKVVGPLAKIVVWYDNEWGYACRVCDLAVLMGDAL